MREMFIIFNLKGEYLSSIGEFILNMDNIEESAKLFYNQDSAETYIRRYLKHNLIPLKIEKIFLKSLI